MGTFFLFFTIRDTVPRFNFQLSGTTSPFVLVFIFLAVCLMFTDKYKKPVGK
jgi:hypothetical protein